MKPKNSIFKSKRLVFFAFGAILGACNIFNPSGDGDAGTDSGALLTEGENKFREKDFDGSMAAFEKAIAQDSSNSLAYYGYSKAAMRKYQLNVSIILKEVGDAQSGKSIPFLNSDDASLTRYLQATSKVRLALSRLTDRDTLSRWYGYLLDSTSREALKDSRFSKRKAWIKDYLDKGEKGIPGYRAKSQFPLHDRELNFEKIVVDFSFVELLYALVHLRDLNNDNIINEKDNLLKKLAFSTEGGLKLDNLKDIAADLASEENRQNVNQLIQNVSSGLGSASEVIKLISPLAGDSLSNQGLTDNVTSNIDSVISTLGSAVTFYQFGDLKDNDGDGCIDEEILDGKDNDDDGFTDEDARIIMPPLPDNVDNDANGIKDLGDASEALNPITNFLIYTENSGFIKGDKYKDSPTRQAIQKDSLAVHYAKGGLSAGQKLLLQAAQKNVGGCWNNYK